MSKTKTQSVSPFNRQRWRAIRDEFELYRLAQYDRALEECSGVLLNERGRKAHKDPFDLFIGSLTKALPFASEELIDWWDANGRLTFKEFQSQMTEQEAA